MKIKITVERGQDAPAAIARMALRLSHAAEKGVGDSLHLVQAGAMGKAPKRYGDLQRSIIVEGPERGEGGYTGKVGPTVRYGRIQELGGPMHGHPLMHWFSPGYGWRKSAFIQLRPRPYLKPAAEATKGTMPGIFEALLAKALEE